MTTLRVLTVTILLALLAMPALAEMGTARGTDRAARPAASPTDKPSATSAPAAAEVSDTSGGAGNLIVVHEDGTPVTSDGRVLILREVTERERAASEADAVRADRELPRPAFSVREYRQAVSTSTPALRLAGHDDRTTASVAMSIGSADRHRKTTERSGLIYSRRIVREGVNGSTLVYEYRVTPAGTKFLYYRDSGNGYGYLRQINDRDNKHWHKPHPHHPRTWRSDSRADDHHFSRHDDPRHDDHKGRAGRLIITTED